MVTQLEEKEITQLRNVLYKFGDFIALFEKAQEKLALWSKLIEEKQLIHERLVKERISELNQLLDDMRGIMSEAGAARWRVAAEEALKAGQAHLCSLQQVNEEYLQYSKESCDRLDQATTWSVKEITRAISAFDLEQLHLLTTESCHEIKKTSHIAISNISSMMKWLQWKNVGIVFLITLTAMMINGLYLNNEWPWEAHEQVMAQRRLAAAVVTAWPELSKADQQCILRSKPTTSLSLV
jgi:hypothetical protein